MKSIEIFWKKFKKQNFKQNGDTNKHNLNKLIILLFKINQNLESISFKLPVDGNFVEELGRKMLADLYFNLF